MNVFLTERHVIEDMGHITPCWIWTGAINQGGYGATGKGSAHRLYYMRYVGPIPGGLDLDHLCRVRHCVNPDHLEPVTEAENTRRGLKTKLTEDQVREIWAAKAALLKIPLPDGRPRRIVPKGSPGALARRYDVDHETVQDIWNGRSWKDVTGALRDPVDLDRAVEEYGFDLAGEGEAA